MREKFRRAWEWFTLAKVPTVGSPVPQCDSCKGRATVFISKSRNGVREELQFCQQHKPHNYRV